MHLVFALFRVLITLCAVKRMYKTKFKKNNTDQDSKNIEIMQGIHEIKRERIRKE